MPTFLIAAVKAELDREVQALSLLDAAKEAAYKLKKKYPAVTFTGWWRDKDDQAQAIANDLALNRVRGLCFICFLLVAPLCTAQRADDRSTTVEINERLRREGLAAVQQKAARGDPDAQLQLAMGYIAGGLLPKDDQLAATWCSKAAHQGFVAAETTLGYLYMTGKGVPQSEKEALRWWRKAADQGSAQAQFNLGEFYARRGSGTKHDYHDYKEALRWFRKAAEQGEPDAQYHLGLLYEFVGNRNEALRWFQLSAAQGFVDARKKAEEYAKLFPPQHEFSFGEPSTLGIDQALEEMARQYSSRPTDRGVQEDIAFPATEQEYRKLGKHAILLIAAVTHDAAELPLQRVYLEKNGSVVELQKIGSFLYRTPAGSAVERVLGPYRENAFYLLPISAFFKRTDLLIDFARNRVAFNLIQFPKRVEVDLILKDPDRAKETTLPVSKDLLHDVVLREYGVDLNRATH